MSLSSTVMRRPLHSKIVIALFWVFSSFDNFGSAAYAQALVRQVIGAGGINYESPAFSVYSSFGEQCIRTFEVPPSQLTQGFQQSYPSISTIRLLIQGYYAGSGLMYPVLQNQGVPGANSSKVDTVSVALVDPTAFGEIFLAKEVLSLDGSLTIALPEAVIGRSCYIRINHRSLVETWSASPVSIGVFTTYDFTNQASKAYGSNQIEMESGLWAMYNADINQDQYVDSFDSPILEYNNLYFITGYEGSDLNGDGFTDSFDSPILEFNNINFIQTLRP